jgi:hypothetical protein
MRRDYTKIGESEGYTRELIDAGIKTIDDWQDLEKDKTMAFSQGFAVNEAIKVFNIPHVSHVAQFGMVCGHGLIGIMAQYKNGMAKIYIADTGCECIPVAIDFEENYIEGRV